MCGWVAQKELNEDFPFPAEIARRGQPGRIERLQARFDLRGVNIAPGPRRRSSARAPASRHFSPSWYEADEANLLPQTLFVGGAPTPPADPPPDWRGDRRRAHRADHARHNLHRRSRPLAVGQRRQQHAPGASPRWSSAGIRLSRRRRAG
ncbi:MAG: hypothetical protein U0521_08920 [Anaerolineae bacterium]